MNILKYPKKVSKSSNICFSLLWVTCLLIIFTSNPIDYRILLFLIIIIPGSYILMIWLCKKIVWDKDDEHI